MRSQPKPRFAFVGWNPFQHLHALELAKAVDGVMIIERRADYIAQFSDDILLAPELPVILWDRERMGELDGMFDVIVCQTIFSQIERIERSKIAMLQYGLAKEPHNHGAWRALADLCLVYGQYTAERISYFCPVEPVGNPRFDRWQSPELMQGARSRLGHLLDPSVQTVLYLPTWGALSTQEIFLDAVLALGTDYNVLIKLHHNTDLFEQERKAVVAQQRVQQFGANDDVLELLAVSDLVLSDYSGAIFDALYCQKPVVLLHAKSDERFGAKLDANSLEYSQSARIGPIVEDPRELVGTVRKVLSGEVSFKEENAAMVTELYNPGPGATQRAAHALFRLAAGGYAPLSQMQSYVREEVRRARLERFGTGKEATKPVAKKKPKKAQK